ncbi:MAG TPA: hypothetical protein VKY89_11150 [Thermoanaerobaculia bacterium]|nr:hypothetical protein [Thermoanaerobaculia bacterium]
MTTGGVPRARLLIPALLLLGCHPGLTPPPAAKSIPEVTEIIEARDLDRGRVLDIKEKFKPQDAEYQRARSLYRQAYARFDGWTNEIVVYILAGTKKDPRTDDTYKTLAEAAGRADNDFAEYVESVTGRSKGVASIAASLVEVGIKIWIELRDAGLKERKVVADYFDIRLKWEAWEAITAGPPSAVTKAKETP